jgi:phosphoenolpyruvate carboxykinase (GTP)
MKPGTKLLQQWLTEAHFQRLRRIRNPALHEFVAEFVELCAPDSVFVSTGSEEDRRYIRQAALRNRQEARLAIAGHTIHFDSQADQARDKRETQFLLRVGENLGPEINSLEKAGLEEMRLLLRNSMTGRQMFVLFYCLGPVGSPFSIPCVQITDSAYVAHSEDLLYRPGYEEFVPLGEQAQLFKVVHSQGRLEQGGLGLQVSADIAKRRVYIDLENEVIYSVNTQYGGNSIGPKKLAMRLAIRRASREGWLTEHMLIVGVRGPNGRVSYLTGAFPSLCGKNLHRHRAGRNHPGR